MRFRSVYRFDEGTRRVRLQDGSGTLWSMPVVAGSPGVRSERLGQRFVDDTGRELAVEETAPGEYVVDLADRPILVVERAFHVPDRTTDRSLNQPYAASASRTGFVFLGREFLLWPQPDRPSRPRTRLHLLDVPNWELVLPSGRGRSVEVGDGRLILDHFVYAGKDPETRDVPFPETTFRLAASARDFADTPALLEELAQVVGAARGALGPLPAGPRLLVLEPYKKTRGLWSLARGGASTGRTQLAYLDPAGNPAGGEHPLGVAAHELTHAWLPHALGPRLADVPFWFTEGAATWYEAVHLWRAGRIDEGGYVEALVGQWNRDRRHRAGQEWTLRQAAAAFTTSPVAQAVVYRRGAVLVAWIDALLRSTGPGDGMDGLVRRWVAGAGTAEGAEGFWPALSSCLDPAGAETVRAALDQAGTFSVTPLLECYGYRVRESPGPALDLMLAPVRAPTVRGVRAGGAADGVLQAGDVIREVAGERVGTTEEFQTRVAALEPGEPVTLGVRRAGERVECVLVPRALADVALERLPAAVGDGAPAPRLLDALGARPGRRP